MKIKKVLYIEDNTTKYMAVNRYLGKQKLSTLDWAKKAEEAIEMIEVAIKEGAPYDLIVSDMHFDFFGEDDHDAGEKVMKLLREKGINTPIIFCSSQNWIIPGAVGNIYYNPYRDWEIEADELFKKLKEI